MHTFSTRENGTLCEGLQEGALSALLAADHDDTGQRKCLARRGELYIRERPREQTKGRLRKSGENTLAAEERLYADRVGVRHAAKWSYPAERDRSTI